MKKILLLLGPNLNLTGYRDVSVYGSETAEEINNEIKRYAQKLGVEMEIFQSNHEGELIDKIQQCALPDRYTGVIINAGAFAHYSYAIRDALECICVPAIEVHMSNIFAREEFRQKSVIAPVCAGQICGFGKHSYLLAIDALMFNS